MTERGAGIAAQLKRYREGQRILKNLERSPNEILDTSRRYNQELAISFLTFRPVIKPILEDIALNYRDASDLPLENPQVEECTPGFSDIFDQDPKSYPGHFALTWGTPWPILSDLERMDLDIYRRLNEKLKSGKKLTDKKEKRYLDRLADLGSKRIEISGLNALIVVAGLKPGFTTFESFVPGAWLEMNGALVRNDRFKDSIWTIQEVNRNEMVPSISKALDTPSDTFSFMSDIKTIASSGYQNIRPQGPYLSYSNSFT